MKKIIEFEEYNPENGIRLTWEARYSIKCAIRDNAVNITANKQGLLCLAAHLANLAQDSIPPGNHLHFDGLNSLEDGSNELIIIKE